MNRTVNDDIIGLDGSVDRKETHRAPYVKGDFFKVPKNFPVSKITSSDEMTITAELANGQVYVLLSAWLHGEANHNAEEGTVDLEFHGEEGDYQQLKELELKKPITADGETLSVLEFDEPTGKDVRELGYPYQMNQDESVKLLAHVVSKYIVRLAKGRKALSTRCLRQT